MASSSTRTSTEASDPHLLEANNKLDPGATATLSFIVRFEVARTSGVFFNSAVARCAGCESDTSTNGNDPDPDGDRAPTENEPTPVPFEVPSEPAAILGLAKAATFGAVVEGALRETTITLVLRNYCLNTARSIDLRDDLSRALATADAFEVVPGSLTATTLMINPAFDAYGKCQSF